MCGLIITLPLLLDPWLV